MTSKISYQNSGSAMERYDNIQHSVIARYARTITELKILNNRFCIRKQRVASLVLFVSKRVIQVNIFQKARTLKEKERIK